MSTPVTPVGKDSHALPFALARNSFYNLSTQVVLMALGLWAIPKIVHGISAEQFGLLSLVWAILGYFSLLDMGVSRAATKYLVDAITGNIVSEIRSILSASLQLTFFVGMTLSVIVWAITPWLVSSALSVSALVYDDAMRSLYWTAAALPFVLLGGIARAAQMAYQRFDIVNILVGSLGVVQWVGSVVLVSLGYGLAEIIALSVIARVITTGASFLFLMNIGPGGVTLRGGWDLSLIKRLFGFGSWVTVSQIISPLFQYADRFLIGSLLTLSAVAYYSVPQEILARLIVIPFSMSLALFPVLSQSDSSAGMTTVQSSVYVRSLRYLFVFVLPISLAGIVLAPEFLGWWVGQEYAVASSAVLQILAVGFLFNAMAQIPVTALQAAGRPDTIAKLHLMEVVPTIGLAALLISILGINGAAIAFTVRVIADCLLLLYAAFRLINKEKGGVGFMLLSARDGASSFLFILLVIGLSVFTEGYTKAGLFALVLLAYILTFWLIFFDQADRSFFVRMYKSALGLIGKQ